MWLGRIGAERAPLVLCILTSSLHKRTSNATGCSTAPCRPVCLGMDSHIRNTCRLSCLLSKCMCNDTQMTSLRDCYFWLEPTGICKRGVLQVAVCYRWLEPTGTCGRTWRLTLDLCLDWKPFVSLAPDECSSVTVILRVRIQLCSWEKTGFAAYHVFHSALVSRQIKIAFLLLLPPIMKGKVAVKQDAILIG